MSCFDNFSLLSQSISGESRLSCNSRPSSTSLSTEDGSAEQKTNRDVELQEKVATEIGMVDVPIWDCLGDRRTGPIADYLRIKILTGFNYGLMIDRTIKTLFEYVSGGKYYPVDYRSPLNDDELKFVLLQGSQSIRDNCKLVHWDKETKVELHPLLKKVLRKFPLSSMSLSFGDVMRLQQGSAVFCNLKAIYQIFSSLCNSETKLQTPTYRAKSVMRYLDFLASTFKDWEMTYPRTSWPALNYSRDNGLMGKADHMTTWLAHMINGQVLIMSNGDMLAFSPTTIAISAKIKDWYEKLLRLTNIGHRLGYKNCRLWFHLEDYKQDPYNTGLLYDTCSRFNVTLTYGRCPIVWSE